MGQVTERKEISLPAPDITGDAFLEHLLQERRSVREYQNAGLSLAQVAQLLWAAQGITDANGFRTAPSAGALYPLELYVVVSNVETLPAGIYHYKPKSHQLEIIREGEFSKVLARASYGQSSVRDAAAVVVFTAIYGRTTRKYGKRGERYVNIEVGHAAENLFIQAQALDLGTVVIGAFYDDEMNDVLQLPSNVSPLLLMPVGHK
jgi:SagB-type dehydrogenase family enzyme